MLDAFTDIKKVKISHILIISILTQINVHEGQYDQTLKPFIKRGHHIGAKDKNPKKKTTQVHISEDQIVIEKVTNQSKVNKQKASEEACKEEQMSKRNPFQLSKYKRKLE